MIINNDTPLNEAIESMNQAIIPVETVINKEVTEIKPVKKIGRPTKMTDQMQAKVIKLAEEYFFIRSIAGEAGISVDTIERCLKMEDYEDFTLSFAYAQNKFISYHQKKLMQYATDKKTKDWRAEAHILTLCDKEFSERKYLTDAVANQDAKILMLIKAEKLTIASQQGEKMLETVISTPLQGQEAISLLPFKPEDPKNKGKPKTQKNKGVNGSRTPYQ